jgi:hypothetical protein
MAAKISDPKDKLAVEMMTAAWEKVAAQREAALKRKSRLSRSDDSLP